MAPAHHGNAIRVDAPHVLQEHQGAVSVARALRGEHAFRLAADAGDLAWAKAIHHQGAIAPFGDLLRPAVTGDLRSATAVHQHGGPGAAAARRNVGGRPPAAQHQRLLVTLDHARKLHALTHGHFCPGGYRPRQAQRHGGKGAQHDPMATDHGATSQANESRGTLDALRASAQTVVPHAASAPSLKPFLLGWVAVPSASTLYRGQRRWSNDK